MIKYISCDSIWKFDFGNVVQIKIGMVISVNVSVKNIMHVKKICMESQNMYLWEWYLFKKYFWWFNICAWWK